MDNPERREHYIQYLEDTVKKMSTEEGFFCDKCGQPLPDRKQNNSSIRTFVDGLVIGIVLLFFIIVVVVIIAMISVT